MILKNLVDLDSAPSSVSSLDLKEGGGGCLLELMPGPAFRARVDGIAGVDIRIPPERWGPGRCVFASGGGSTSAVVRDDACGLSSRACRRTCLRR